MTKNESTMSGFGGTKRINHNASSFYKRKIFDNINIDRSEDNENDIGKYRNMVLYKNSKNLKSIPDSSVHLVVTSPPYNVGKEYDKNLDLTEYLAMLDNVFAETHRLLVNGGRVCINIANIGRKPYIPYHSYIIDIMSKNGFNMRGEVIWNKGAGAGTSTAWGSWMSATNPVLRDVHEYILIFTKGKFGRNKGTNTITRDQFLEYTKSIWNFKPERAKHVGHPAPFPVELPYRCIQLYSFKGDVVFDPFAGSGSTAIASIKSGRDYLMVDNNREYVRRMKNRIMDCRFSLT